MINVNFGTLNKLEQQIHQKLVDYSKTNELIRINQAAEVCNCSVSKISKFVRKLGFDNYKQYLDFLKGKELPEAYHSTELSRISKFIEDFDQSMVDDLLELIDKHNKIVLFGFGPSLICAQYFEYRLRIFTSKTVMAVGDEISVASMTDENTLLILITVTGTFHTFAKIYSESKKKKCEVAMVAEEYNTDLFSQCDRIFWLSKYNQPNNLKPYEKSRTVFFIFLEEVMQRIILKNKEKLKESKESLIDPDIKDS